MDYSITKDKFNALKQGATAADSSDAPAAAAPSSGAADSGDESDQGQPGGDGMEVDSDDPGEEEDDDEFSDDNDDSEQEEDDDDDEDSDGGGGGGADAAAGAERPRAPDVQHGCTVFVRNVAFDCGQEEVKERFSAFGTVRLALLVKDRATGMPRGTAFVKVREAGRCCCCIVMTRLRRNVCWK